MALSLAPPDKAVMHTGINFWIRPRNSPMTLLALARFLWISTPECPPCRPSTVSLTQGP